MKLTKKMIKEAIRSSLSESRRPKRVLKEVNEQQLALAIENVEKVIDDLSMYRDKLEKDPSSAFHPTFARRDGKPHEPLKPEETIIRLINMLDHQISRLQSSLERIEQNGLGPEKGWMPNTTAPWDTDPGGSRDADVVQKWKDSTKKGNKS